MDFLFWLIIFGAGFFAQHCIANQEFFFGLLLYIAAGAGAFCLIIRNQISSEEDSLEEIEQSKSIEESASVPAIHFDSQWLILLFAVFAWFGSNVLEWKGIKQNLADYSAWSLYAWIGFIVLTLLSTYKIWLPLCRELAWKEWLPLGCLLFLSLLLGLFHLTSVPATVHGDEGMVGVYARQILEGKISSFFTLSWYEIPQFFFFIPACTMKLFGDSLFGLRMSAVFLGTASLIPFYILVKDWWGTKAAVFGGILLVTNHWFLFLSHSGVNYVQNCFFAITLLCLWHFANKNHSIGLNVLAGISLGFSLVSYQANHLLPILWCISQLWMLLLHKIHWKWAVISILLPLVTAMALITPWYTYHIAKNEDIPKNAMFTNRAGGVGIWTESNHRHLNFSYHTEGDFNKALRIQVERAYLAPIYYSDTSMQYSGTKPFLDYAAAILFMVALVVGSFYFFDTRWSIPILWIFAILTAGGVLTVDAPFYPRLAGLTTLFFILIAGLFASVMNTINRNSLLSMAAYGVFGVCAIYSVSLNLPYFFGTYAHDMNPKNAHYSQTQLGYFVKEKPKDSYFYVFSGVHMMFNSGTVSFLAKEYNGRDLEKIPDSWKEPPFWIVIDGSRANVLYSLKEKFPAAKETKILSPEGFVLFYSLLIE